MDLTELSKEIFSTNKEKGFWENHFGTMYLVETNDNFSKEQAKAIQDAFVSQKLMLITTEIGEAMEALRDDNYSIILKDWHFDIEDRETKIFFEDNIKNTFEDEIADSIIRLLDLSGGLNIDIQKHIDLKLKYNKTRGYKHGKQF
jgi:hypothetical protein